MKFGLFILIYSFMKLLRMMLAATVWMSVVLILCKITGIKNWRLHLVLYALVPVSCLMANSKIFFNGKLFLLTNWLQDKVNEQLAVMYFLIAGMLAVRYLYVQKRMRQRLIRMQRLKETEKDAALQGRGPKIRVYMSKECASPFAGGILRPFIVLPQTVQNSLTKKQLSAVLYHEALHIRQGHILLLHIYAWLKIAWWVHPLIYIVQRKLGESIEYGSDEGSVMRGPLSPYEYASVLLAMLQTGNQEALASDSVTAFTGYHYDVLKKRVERLAMLAQNSKTRDAYERKGRLSAMLAAAAFCLTAAAAIGTSMPRYTTIKKIAAYDEKLCPLTYDMKQEGFQAEADEEGFYISEKDMQRFCEKYDLRGEYVLFSYGVIEKVPGVGGFGQLAKVRIQNPSEVLLLARQEWIDQLQAFVMKYLI